MDIQEGVKHLKKYWEDARVIILLSLALQVFLVFAGPLRKATSRKFLILIIWSAYMLAQWTATFGVGLIIQNLDDIEDDADQEESYLKYLTHIFRTNVLAFWAPFLLLHLGYSDNITAFTVETQEWLSHIYRLIFQVAATLYAMALLRSFLIFPALLIFIAGVINNVEKTYALYLASQDRFKKPNPVSESTAKLTKETVAEISRKMGGELNDLEVIQYAHYSYKTFRGLVFNQIYNSGEQTEIRKLFSSTEAENALRLLEVELNFFYQVLQTKAEFVHSIRGYICRFLAFGLVATVLVFFHETIELNARRAQHWRGKEDKSANDVFKDNILITYGLLFCALFQEVMAVIKLVFSDWTFAAPMPYTVSKFKRYVHLVLSIILVMRRPRWHPCECEVKHEVLATPILFRRWSGSLSTYNLIGYCLKVRPPRIHYHKKDCLRILTDKITDLSGFAARIWLLDLIIKRLRILVKKLFQFLWLKDLWCEIRYVSKEPLTKDLWKFIFSELKDKSQYAYDRGNIKQLCSTRGDCLLGNGAWESCSSELTPYLADVSYEHSLLLWHIATELCYNTSTNAVNDESPDRCGFYSNNYREFSKILSDHMLYLLLMMPNIMSAVVEIGGTTFQETCTEAERFFNEKCSGEKQLSTCCEQILFMSPNTVNEVTSKSVLFEAVTLANKLKRLQEENGKDIWKLLGKIWLEKLSYAACRCSSHEHANQLSSGGEFITFVWLLMAHFGLGDSFQDERIPRENV